VWLARVVAKTRTSIKNPNVFPVVDPRRSNDCPASALAWESVFRIEEWAGHPGFRRYEIVY
jgi:hypothetical protein